MPIERKLAAIMFTDIAGSTAQMSKDEAVAISLLNKKESLLKSLIAQHNGTYVNSTGDGVNIASRLESMAVERRGYLYLRKSTTNL